jgi:TetR/AcrR family transcriptional repressor of lmrAB and yxaGH operons
METATTSPEINEACHEAYQMLKSAFHDKLIECGYSKTKADELASFIVSAIEGGIILSRTSHTADPLRLVAKQLKALLAS